MRHDQLIYLFFFNDTATTEIYTLSLHDALPISAMGLQILFQRGQRDSRRPRVAVGPQRQVHAEHESVLGGVADQAIDAFDNAREVDRKSTRLNSSHSQISYAVFCLKKKKQIANSHHRAHDSSVWL